MLALVLDGYNKAWQPVLPPLRRAQRAVRHQGRENHRRFAE